MGRGSAQSLITIAVDYKPCDKLSLSSLAAAGVAGRQASSPPVARPAPSLAAAPL